MMDWKDFLKPDRKKVIVFVVMIIITFPIIFFLSLSIYVFSMSGPFYIHIAPLPLPIITYTESCRVSFELAMSDLFASLASNDQDCVERSFVVNYHYLLFDILLWFSLYIGSCTIIFLFNKHKR